MAEWIKLASVDDIPEGTMKAVEHRYNQLVICHTEDGFHAVANECSHDFAPIGGGKLVGKEIVCPRHGAKFDMNGFPTAPPAVAPIDTFEVKIEGNDILVLLD